MPARLPVLVRGRARRSCRPAAATRRAPPRTLPHQGSLTHPVSCWHRLAPRPPRHDSYRRRCVRALLPRPHPSASAES
eukprot:scaffold49626_cov60-Phaeocystis_antarctica.AAC.1